MIAAVRQQIWHKRKAIWRTGRMLFPSPAEVHFVRLFGGKALTLDFLKSTKTGFPLTFIYSRGRFLKYNFMQREVRVGAMYVDFAFVDSVSKKAVEIDGSDYHRDVLKEQDRDEYLALRGWRVLHIPAMDLYRQPGRVQQKVFEFLAS